MKGWRNWLAAALLFRAPSPEEQVDLDRSLHVLRRYAPLLLAAYLAWLAFTTLPALFRDRGWPYYVTALLVPQVIVYAVASSAARAWIDRGARLDRASIWVPFVIGALAGLLGVLIGYVSGKAGGNTVELWFIETFSSIGWVFVAIMLFSLWPELVRRLRQRERRQLQRLAAAQAETERAARTGAEAELRLLQAQVEPHFLYNTLANLRYLIQKGSGEALAMTDALIEYLRASVPNLRAQRTTLGHDADQIGHYLAIMKMRMGGRLDFTVNVPPELRSVELPPLVLITLVENAIKHGLAPSIEGGSVTVTARSVGDGLEVEVADDGVGIGAAVPLSPSTRAGLANTRERLQLTYGEAAWLELRANSPRGAVARLRVPLTMPMPVPGTASQQVAATRPSTPPLPLRHRGPSRTWTAEVDGLSIRVVDSWFGGTELWIDGGLHGTYTGIWSLPPDEPVLSATVRGASGREHGIEVILQAWSFNIRAAILVDGERIAGDAT
ncbi:MAG TPA: histidine kinase [Burkholderiaceae bacterium]|nr:histidine kinase [Burkholderiaceae bacterium]HQR71806.1 histidine kinase [Burkholderiaceae bacterium]